MNIFARTFAVVLFALPSASAHAAKPPLTLMTPRELQALPSKPADHRVAYGTEASQFGELRVPSGKGPHPVVVLVHGGCFKAQYATLRDLAPMGDALKSAGIATWNVEYRRLGEDGGGWPGTYQDVGRGVDHLRVLAREHRLDLDRLVIVGHSAGGHLALWAAARARLPQRSELYVADPLRVRGALDLGGIADLAGNIAEYEALCGDKVITSLAGGSPAEVPQRYAEASAAQLLPTGVPQVVLIGEHENFMPAPLARHFVEKARKAGDRAQLIIVPGAGHFEIASPDAATWPRVSATITKLLDGKLP